ncbi:unnamed protein product [Spirodela intermedia]|uniref:Uncharacterized protein n=1 Tax=Spirodela intermedia TaxID=51605 RepID=A0A7I8INC0_SPIIN|nr:unnamed protein product [Spirodela intermedia]CAA6659445.1 unnamed protein product [Spirodela intermedia]
MRQYIELYGSSGWNSLVCHADFLTMFFPEKATSLACSLLSELVKELRSRPLPVIFAAFSGGPKACMYKVLQIIEGKYEGLLDPDECQLVNDCICGQIYDSSPVDFTSDLGTRLILHPTAVRVSEPRKLVSWMAKMVASGLDTLFLSRFEAQRAEYWQTLYSSAKLGPILILCSEDDELAPRHIICNFAHHLREEDGDVKLVIWKSSPHLGHYDHHPDDYKSAVFELLSQAVMFHSRRVQLSGAALGMGSSGDQISESVCDLHRAAVCSNESFRRVATRPSDHFSCQALWTTLKHKGGLFHVQNPPGMNPHGVLGQMLFDVCVPKNVEGWDIKPTGPLDRNQKLSRRPGPFNPMKCIRRCRM